MKINILLLLATLTLCHNSYAGAPKSPDKQAEMLKKCGTDGFTNHFGQQKNNFVVDLRKPDALKALANIKSSL